MSTPPPPASPPPPPPAPTAAGGTATGAPVEPPRRLHPFGILRGINLRAALSSIPALFVLGTQADIGFVAGLVALAVVGVIARIVGWTRHTYELRGGRIIERYGVLSRTERALEIERIQQIDIERTLLDRAVGTCELRMETAADSGDSELTLTVVTVEEAERLRGVLAAASARLAAGPGGAGDPGAAAASAGETGPGPDGAETDHPGPDGADRGERELVSVPTAHVALAAVTGPRLLVIPAGIALVIGLIGDAFRPGPEETTEVASEAVDLAVRLGPVIAGLLVLAALVLALVVVAVVGVLRDGGFEIVRRGEEIVVRRGLTTTRSATVPLRRVQKVTVGRSWLHTRLGFATVTIHTAGSVTRGGQGDNQAALDRSLGVPLLPEADVAPLLDELLGTGEVPTLARHPRMARRRAVVRAVARLAPVGLAVGVAAGIATESVPLGVAVPVVALVVGVLVGLGHYARLATGVGDELVCGRTGLFGTSLTLAPRRKVQGVRVSSSWFQRRRGLASASVHLAGAGGGLTLVDLADTTATTVQRTLT